MNDDLLLKELDNILVKTEGKLNGLNESYKSVVEVQQEMNESEHIDWDNLAEKINAYESNKYMADVLRQVKENNKLIQKLFQKQTPYDAIKFLVQLTEGKADKEVISDLLIKVINENRFIIEDWLVKLKFPLLDGNIIFSVLNEFKNTSSNKFEFFSDYFIVMNYLLLDEEKDFGNFDQTPQKRELKSSEIFTVYLFKKIMHSLITPFFSSIAVQANLEREAFDFSEILVKYFSKSLSHTFELISSCLSDYRDNNTRIKSDSIRIMNFLIKNLILQVNITLSKHEKFISALTKSPENFHKIIILFSNMNKTLYKEYSYNIYNEVLISDLLIEEIKNEELGDYIQIQKSFDSVFIKSHLKEKLTETIEKEQYAENTEEVFDMMRMLIKDNYQFMLCFKNNSLFMEYANEQNFYYCLKEMLSIFRSSYNEEIQIFSSKHNISKRKDLFLLNLVVKLLIYINKIYQKINSGVKDNILKEVLNKHTASILGDINKMIENYSLIIVKELRTNGFDELINLFTYKKLSKLDEDKIKEAVTKVKRQIKTLFADLDRTKVSIETENCFFNFFLHTVISKIIEECEKSLKRVPKNKNFSILTEKTLKLIDQLTSRYTLDQHTLNSIQKQLKSLKSCFTSLNMNKI